MKILNLANPTCSDIGFKVYKFPDGQQNVVILGFNDNLVIDRHPDYLQGNIVKIKSRLNNWLDLELIICTVASLRELGIIKIHLYVPSIIGARSDRKFESGGNNYLKDVICPVINSLGFETVTCIDPHSDCLEMGISGFIKESNKSLVRWALAQIKGIENIVVVSPDAGASKKIFKLMDELEYQGEILTCSKDRDKDGKLTKCVVPVNFEHVGKDIVIIDDIGDGFGTFINIAKEIKREFEGSHTKNKIYLIITHSIFSKGIDVLREHFTKVFCTNSIKDIKTEDGFLIQYDIFK